MTDDLPYVDEHALVIAAPPYRVWEALEGYASEQLTRSAEPVVARLLGTDPAGGFAVADASPGERIALVGRHRFARYRLVFEVTEAGAECARLAARSYATFPGPHGAVYRLLVIRSRFHVLATRRMLRAVRRRALADRGEPGPHAG